MAAKTSAATGSRSDAIRDYLKAHPQAAQKEIAAALSAQGVTVSAALINKIKYGKTSSGRKRKAGRVAGSRNGAGGTSNGSGGASNGMAGTSKAQAIRDAFASLGRRTRPRDVIAHLREQGTVVSAAQVSALRQNLRKRGRAAGSSASGGRVSNGRASGQELGLSVAHLLAAKKLADQVGFPAAKKALEVLARLGSP